MYGLIRICTAYAVACDVYYPICTLKPKPLRLRIPSVPLPKPSPADLLSRLTFAAQVRVLMRRSIHMWLRELTPYSLMRWFYVDSHMRVGTWISFILKNHTQTNKRSEGVWNAYMLISDSRSTSDMSSSRNVHRLLWTISHSFQLSIAEIVGWSSMVSQPCQWDSVNDRRNDRVMIKLARKSEVRRDHSSSISLRYETICKSTSCAYLYIYRWQTNVTIVRLM